MDDLNLDDEAFAINQSATFTIGYNSVHFPKEGFKINNNGMQSL